MVVSGETREKGLMPIYIDGELKSTAEKAGEQFDPVTPMIAGQVLPLFNPEDPMADVLYGYDMIGEFNQSRRNAFTKFALYQDKRSTPESGKIPGPHQQKNAEFRKQQKNR